MREAWATPAMMGGVMDWLWTFDDLYEAAMES